VKAELRHLHLQALDHRHGGVFVEVVDDQHLERPRMGSLHDTPKSRHHILTLVVDRNDDAQRG
jgi:hypothetical protein